MNKKIYYLAYGSNLNIEQMKRRCPNAIKVGTSIIEDYELEFRYYLTIVPSTKNKVPVGVWLVDEQDEASLDIYEGYPTLYRKEYIEITVNNEKVNALVYIMNDVREKSKPSQVYLNTCRQGYKDFNLDISYLNKAYEKSITK